MKEQPLPTDLTLLQAMVDDLQKRIERQIFISKRHGAGAERMKEKGARLRQQLKAHKAEYEVACLSLGLVKTDKSERGGGGDEV